MKTEQKKRSLFSNVTNAFKFKMFLSFCIPIHSMIAILSFCNHITPLLIYNIGSIIVYIICCFIIKRRPILVFYIGYIEIILHSFVCVLLIGNGFGFSMYFVTLVPMAYNLLYSTRTSHYLKKATFLAILSFLLFACCYTMSNFYTPVYTSEALDFFRPFIYIANMLIIFSALLIFSILFIVETEHAYNRIYSQNRELDSLANRDPLTGLYNRRVMMEHVMQMYEESKNSMLPFSLIICDIDNFKLFNDTYGHDCGDTVLKSISGQLTALTRGHDFLCRWGGEEFLILLKNIDADMAKDIAERIRIHISKTDIKYNDFSLRVTMTFGIASSTETDDYESLFKLADERLYKGKNTGKNCIV